MHKSQAPIYEQIFHAQPYSATCPHPFFSEFGTPVQIRSVEHPRTVGKKVSGRRKSPDMAVFFST